jgi:hypothetical protein
LYVTNHLITGGDYNVFDNSLRPARNEFL